DILTRTGLPGEFPGVQRFCCDDDQGLVIIQVVLRFLSYSELRMLHHAGLYIFVNCDSARSASLRGCISIVCGLCCAAAISMPWFSASAQNEGQAGAPSFSGKE